MTDESLNEHQKAEIRKVLVETAQKLIGVKYEFGAEWNDYSKPPETLDCSELVEAVYHINGLKMPDGAQNQYNFCLDTPQYQDGDLGFFGKGAKPAEIYHVGIAWNGFVIEARGFDPSASFETGKVITRPIERWTGWKNFVGWRTQPKLA